MSTKPNKFIVSAVLFLKSSNTRKVDWIEDRLMKIVKEDGKEYRMPLTTKEMDAFLQNKFKEWKDKGTTIVRKNIKGENSLIPFSEVEYATFKVELYEEGKETEGKDWDITQHPAYTEPRT